MCESLLQTFEHQFVQVSLSILSHIFSLELPYKDLYLALYNPLYSLS